MNTSPIVLDILTFVVLEECPTDLSFMSREDIIFFILVLGVRIVWSAYLYGDCASSLLNFLKFRKVVLPHFLHCVGVAARKSMYFLKVTVCPLEIIPAKHAFRSFLWLPIVCTLLVLGIREGESCLSITEVNRLCPQS